MSLEDENCRWSRFWWIVANWWGRTMGSENATIFRTPTASDPVLGEVVRRLVEAYRPERIYLFGSVARGDAGPDSDYDIMVVVPDEAPPELRRSRAAYEVLWGTGVAADVLVWTASQFNSRVHLAVSLPATVIREGRLLHAA
jgi:predicted nucleotidyltransferase